MDGYESSCRLRNSSTEPWFPQSNEEFDDVSDIIIAKNSTSRCLNAICIPLSLTAYADIKAKPNDWAQFGATYGQFTRNELADLGVASNPILSSSVPRAWYWIEAFRYSEEITMDADVASKLVPSAERNFVYRITAVALGMRPGTKVVLRSVFVPYPKNQGQ
jgi:type IV pilus assembly protein PilX